ncbi:MAG TPA: hypothetical protein VL132_22095 [Planctomycetaceae bacterium]|nr:hypothetical protein [Planctomycetaceae bacterium]
MTTCSPAAAAVVVVAAEEGREPAVAVAVVAWLVRRLRPRADLLP